MKYYNRINRRCYLCNNTQKPGVKSLFSLHKFPPNPETCSLWIQACGLYAYDNVTTLRICSDHFNPKDYNAKRADGLLKLKLGAVPSISVPNPININTNFTLDLTLPSTSTNSKIITHAENAVPDSVINVGFLNEANEFTSENFQFDDTGTEPNRHTKEIDVNTEEENVVVAPKKKRFAEPPYVGDITSLDVSSPERAEECLFIARRTISKQKKEIKSLQQKTRRLTNKITSFKELIHHLRKKDLLSEESENTLMVLIK